MELLVFLLCFVPAVIGIIIGAVLWYRSGTMTVGVWVRFSLVLPLCALVTFVFWREWRRGRRTTDEKCIWQGCQQRRVQGAVYCADHPDHTGTRE